MAKKEIAIIEDERVIRENYSDYLTRQGYAVSGFATRQDAMAAFDKALPDLVILDIGLADDIDGGFELCRELRKRSATLPIIFLTARDSDLDSVSGLRLGADDYLTKEISLPHLVARIAALFRRIEAMQQKQPSESLLVRGDLKLDSDRLAAHWQGTLLNLTVTEFWMLHALVRHPGHVRSRDQLMEEANIYVDSASITTHIKRIRRKFQEVDTDFTHIDSVYGAGYRWQP
ncbi:MAG: proteobacterial dedicated sortase system response regulator [Candidatus Thiodiazotropha sp. (ex Lucinoma borealis)]|nr:proteobacterial dedicated sortase system response regulator [Candidatus Thiodiazotropha sp. (ex Troendleina suluensis)]MCU7856115.1 proteobacterial dedicated sortase system response regulator [Candidatus Thiodiazotropha sp. (ex Lucinoma borealis)]MCU7863566.1 proteobacterial dedicated sortase system response regulator [Candidatus Thiodiazotropha sp. (ex Lucinoma borealis)]MCU7867242.1 proteobacterial dedicated sortase system response regulator [Candidatus Thiodiazotropha sp. (ex Lucinoma bore